MTSPSIEAPRRVRAVTRDATGRVVATSAAIEPRLVPVDQIMLVADANRDMRRDVVAKIVREFDPNRLHLVTLNLRDGKLRLVDGQHRILACREKGYARVWAVVHEGMTDEWEADQCVRLNRDRLALNAWDMWRLQLKAGHQDVVMMNQIVEAAGFKVTRTSGLNHVGATGAIRRAFALGGAPCLTDTMLLVRTMWNIDERHATTAVVIEGAAMFAWSFLSDPKLEPEHLGAVLNTQPASSLIGRAKKILRETRIEEEFSGGLSGVFVARAITEFYNAGMPPAKRLGDVVGMGGRRVGARRTRP